MLGCGVIYANLWHTWLSIHVTHHRGRHLTVLHTDVVTWWNVHQGVVRSLPTALQAIYSHGYVCPLWWNGTSCCASAVPLSVKSWATGEKWSQVYHMVVLTQVTIRLQGDLIIIILWTDSFGNTVPTCLKSGHYVHIITCIHMYTLYHTGWNAPECICVLDTPHGDPNSSRFTYTICNLKQL